MPLTLNMDEICQKHELAIQSVALRDGEARVILVAKGEPDCPCYVLELREVRALHAYFDEQVPVCVAIRSVSCLGLWLPDRSAYRQVSLLCKSFPTHTFVVAIAGQIRFREACPESGDLCFPG